MNDAAAPPRPPSQPRTSSARNSVTLKLVAIGLVILLLMVPAMMLEGLIREREQMRDSARREVAARWGLEQTVSGPVLTIPYVVRTTTNDGEAHEVTRYAHFLPDVLEVEGTITPQVRTRGIYRVVLYNTQLRLRGQFPRPDAATLGLSVDALRPAEAFVSLGIPDMRGVEDAVQLRWADSVHAANPGIPTADVFPSGVHVPVPLDAAANGYPFAVDLDLNGSDALGFLPVGKETHVHLTSPWTTPSFTGAFLPDRRAVTDGGFEATWRVLHLNRNYGQAFLGPFGQPTALVSEDEDFVAYPARTAAVVEPATGAAPSAFGVALLLPVDEYQKTARAAKYCMLFVFLTFVTFFFVEILGGRQIHPVQYLLVGFAITLFYLLLLSIAEYVPFGSAYFTAAGAILALVTLYAKAIFREWRLAAVVAGLLALFYGYFYVLLQLEAYALLFGSLGLLVTLAVVMYLSRHVDWYGFGSTPVPPTLAPPASAAPASS